MSRNESIAKSELESLCGGSNLSWIVRIALSDWIDHQILFGDSMIALCWATSEKLRLSLFHRNRVLQIRRGTALEDIYHVRTDFNPSDCGTRPQKVKITDVGQDSRWENGDPWMTMEISEAVNQKILKPATELRVSKEIENDFNEGLVFGNQDEIDSRGHVVKSETACFHSENRLKKIQERAEFSDYLIIPTKYSFPKTVRIYTYVMTFIRKCRRNKEFKGKLLCSTTNLWFSVFSCSTGDRQYECIGFVTDESMDNMKSISAYLAADAAEETQAKLDNFSVEQQDVKGCQQKNPVFFQKYFGFLKMFFLLTKSFGCQRKSFRY